MPSRNSVPAADSLAFSLLRAAEILDGVIEGKTLDAMLSACWQQYRPYPAQRGAIQDLAYSALRAGPRGDFLLTRLVERPLRNTLVRALLLVALCRLEQRPEDAHTIVDQAVNAAAGLAQGKFRGLVNAVLRNYLRQREVLRESLQTDPAALWQHPAWWLRELRAAYPSRWQDVLAAANDRPPMTLRANRRHGDAAAYLQRLLAAGIDGQVLDDAAIKLTRPLAVENLPGFGAGEVSVQDWGAQQAARLLDARAGMRVLDACAAPGGKSAHLLERADVDLTAIELDPLRARRIDENLQRLGLHALVKVADCADLAQWWDGRPFERILADVPCSASGVARRHPDIKWLRRARDIAQFAASQRRIVDALWQTLAVDGRMLYCTCSIFPRENGEQLAAFLARHADAVQLPIGNGTELQLLPNADQDGFYYALLQKRA